MSVPPEIDLTIEDVALLVDGTGISDGSARKLAPFFAADPRLAEPLAHLRRLAEDAGADCLWHAVKIDQDLDELIAAGDWNHPAEVLDADAGICYPELISLAASRASKTAGPQKCRLLDVGKRMERAYADEQAVEDFFQRTIDRLLALERDRADALLARLVEHHRFRRENPDWKPASGD